MKKLWKRIKKYLFVKKEQSPKKPNFLKPMKKDKIVWLSSSMKLVDSNEVERLIKPGTIVRKVN